MNDILTIIIIVLIIGIVLDGIRRARNNASNKVKLSRNARKADKYFESQQNPNASSEFPSGGARPSTIARPDQDQKEEAATKSVQRKKPLESPAQETLDFGESVPMLMDSVEDEAQNEQTENLGDAIEVAAEDWQDEAEVEADENETYETQAHSQDTAHEVEHTAAGGTQFSSELSGSENANAGIDDYVDRNHLEPSIGQLDDLDSLDELSENEASAIAVATDKNTDDFAQTQNRNEPKESAAAKDQKVESHSRFHFGRSRKSENKLDDGLDDKPAEVPVEEILIINVMAKNGTMFDGVSLQNAFIAEGLKFGQRQIFHRHQNNDGDAPILFSVANIMEPGYFTLTEMNEIETRGICVFLTLPAPVDAIQAYDDMTNTAKALASMLDGEMKDENRSVMTRQNIEHGRQRVIEFERRRKLLSK